MNIPALPLKIFSRGSILIQGLMPENIFKRRYTMKKIFTIVVLMLFATAVFAADAQSGDPGDICLQLIKDGKVKTIDVLNGANYVGFRVGRNAVKSVSKFKIVNPATLFLEEDHYFCYLSVKKIKALTYDTKSKNLVIYL